MKLNQIKVCVECDEVVAVDRRDCPSCTDTVFWFPRNGSRRVELAAIAREARRGMAKDNRRRLLRVVGGK